MCLGVWDGRCRGKGLAELQVWSYQVGGFKDTQRLESEDLHVGGVAGGGGGGVGQGRGTPKKLWTFNLMPQNPETATGPKKPSRIPKDLNPCPKP